MRKNLEISECLNIFIMKDKGIQIFCKISEIVFIKSEGDYIRIYNPKPSCLIIGTLKKISQQLPDYFILSHKSYIINIKRIKKCKKIIKNKYCLIMDNNMEIPLAKTAITKINVFFT